MLCRKSALALQTKRIIMPIYLISQSVGKGKFRDYDFLFSNYTEYFENKKINLVRVSNFSKDLKSYLREFKENRISGIILTGGNSITPKLYGSSETLDDVSIERDNTEKALLDFAVKNETPVLGICRGFEFINVYFGGKIRALKDVKNTINHVAAPHDIQVTDPEAIKFIGSKAKVNSFHNYGIISEDVSKKLKVFAAAEDDTIEGLYHHSLPIAGIMWHPERPGCDEKFNDKLVNAFLNRDLFWK